MEKYTIVIGLFICLGFGCRPSDQAPMELMTSSTPSMEPEFDLSQPAKRKALGEAIAQIYQEEAEKNHYPGYAYGIVMDNALLFSGTGGVTNTTTGEGVTLASQFHIASMTKSFTAMAIVKLRDEGKLSLIDPAVKYLPELASLSYLSQDASPITILNLLTMTSGFPEDNPWADRQLEDSDEEFVQLMQAGIPFANIPSYQYEYSNLGYAMLGTIVSRVAGEPYQSYISRQILMPLGMTDTYWEYAEVPAKALAQGYRWEEEQWKPEPMLHSGAFGAIGGLITSINDFSKYVAFHLSVWPPSDKPETGPIKRSSVREMQQALMPRLFAQAKDLQGNPCPFMAGYGYGLGIRKDCNNLTRVSHSGGLPGFGSEYRFFPDYGIGIIAFFNRTYAGAGAANARVTELLFEKSGIQPTPISLSPILAKRTPQVIELLRTWDETLGAAILAENFYLDQSRALRMKEAEKIMATVGEIKTIDPLVPLNQLRGTFLMHGEQGDLEVFFSLSPEKEPKVQALSLRKI
ncbi:MAG: serine hydrolase domain-containing protein [Saprospiraceae bacterium]